MTHITLRRDPSGRRNQLWRPSGKWFRSLGSLVACLYLEPKQKQSRQAVSGWPKLFNAAAAPAGIVHPRHPRSCSSVQAIKV